LDSASRGPRSSSLVVKESPPVPLFRARAAFVLLFVRHRPWRARAAAPR
jgi:hypothetical protein